MPATPTLDRPTASRPSIPADRVYTPAANNSVAPEHAEPPRVQNRVRVLLTHIPMFSVQGQARLAARAGVSRSTISRLVRGRISPSYRLARAVTDALERQMGRPLDMRDVFTTDGAYPEPSGCALCGCSGCLPDEAYSAEGDLLPEWRGQRPGHWSASRPMVTAERPAVQTIEGKDNAPRKEAR